jgi:ferredoxin-NADP reductase
MTSRGPSKLEPVLRGRRRETGTVTTFVFDLEGQEFDYRAGQHVVMELDGVDDPRGRRRPFTLSSSPCEPGILAVTTKMTGSPFKERLRELPDGAGVKLTGPIGSFTLEPGRAAVMIAGGIGITPFRSMLVTAAERGDDLAAALLYSSSVPSELTFREELDALAERAPDVRVVYTITRPEQASEPWSGPSGHLSEELLRRGAGGLDDPLYYLCGPPSMVDDVRAILLERLGIRQEAIRLERFTGY